MIGSYGNASSTPRVRRGTRERLAAFLVGLGLVCAGAARADQGRYLDTVEFLDLAFYDAAPQSTALWIDDGLRASIESLLGHRYGALRIRYWKQGEKSAWILDEIGKEQPITIGVTVVAGAVDMVRVLEFREPRGWEIRHPFFTDQFAGVRVDADRQIDRAIDGITGATLSVAAVTRAVKLALFLSDQVGRRPS